MRLSIILVLAQHILLEEWEQGQVAGLQHCFDQQGGQAAHDDKRLHILLVVEHLASRLQIPQPLQPCSVLLAAGSFEAAATASSASDCQVP